jgi:phosphoglycolate phosphatase-like HAD superfamily hydrolase
VSDKPPGSLAELVAGARAVAFDFDGVIVESVEVKTAAFLALFADRPDLHDAIRRHHLEHLGRSRYEKLSWIHRELLGEPLDETRLAELGERFSGLVFEATVACPLVPGAVATLEALAAAGLPAFVASGTPEEELREIIERRGLARHFEGVRGSPTPKTQILWRILAERALRPEELIFVGDGLSDHRAAWEVGLPFLLRETPDQAALFAGLPVPRCLDLSSLPELFAERTPEVRA